MPPNNESPSNHATDVSEFETQFVPRSNDDEVLYEVEEITAEKLRKYRVKWAGLNPATQKPWPQSWVDKRDCTVALVEEWKLKKAKKEKQKQKDGSHTKMRTRSRSSNSLSVPSSSRRTRRSGASEPSPQIPSEDEHPTHASTSHIKKEQSAKRKRKSSSETRRAVSRNDMDEREGSSRPRKKRKIGIEVKITTTPKRGVYSANGNGNTYKVFESESDGDKSSEPEGVASATPAKIGQPRGAKPQSSSGNKLKIGGASEDAPMLPLTIAHLPKPERRPTSKVAGPSKEKTSPARTFIREPILSPGAIARLELFDRVMASSSDGDHGDTDASASTEPSHKRLKRTPHKSHRNTIETPPAMGSSKQHSPQKTSASKLIKAMLPKLDSDEDSSSNASDRESESPPRPSPKAHRGTSRTAADGSLSRRIDVKQRPGSSSTSSLVLPRPTNGKAAGKNKEVDSFDLPEIAVIPERSSTTPFDELPSSPPVKTKRVNFHPHPAMKPVPQISPNTFKTKLKLVGPGNAVSSEPPPSSIESFASPQPRRPFIRKQLSTGAAKKTVPLSTAEQSSEEDVEQDDEDRHQENANGMAEEEEEESDGNNDEEARPKGRPTDSEVRKRGKELFDEQQRKRDAKRAVAAQPKRLKPLANIMGRLTSAKEISPVAGASYNEGAAADDCLDSVVQEMEDAYVDLSGKTQSATMETSAPNNTVQKSWATMTAEEREALRIQLRQEEEENTQEAIHVPAPAVQDSGTYTYDYIEEDAMHVSLDPQLPEPVQVASQERSTRTENIQQASVIVQASQGQRQSDGEDLDVVQSLPQPPSSLPREPSSCVPDTPKRRLHEAVSLLNVKSEEIQRLQFELAQERQSAERAQAELTKVTGECETLRTSVSEEHVKLQEERASLEERRKRWTEDRLTWTEELERWKLAHDVWKKQRDELPDQQLKLPEQPTGMNGAAKTYSEENRPILNGGHTVASGMNVWEAERKAFIEERGLLSEKVSQLSASVDQMAAAKASVETDRDFFREQYARASGFVSSVRAENAELEERVKIAEGQAGEGVAKIKQLFETNVKALQDDIHRWKSLAEMLQEKDSRTNDEVRTRAAQTTELESLCRTLLRDNNSLESDLRKLGRALQRVSVQRNKLSSKVLSITKEKAKLKAKLAKYSDSQDSFKPTQDHSPIIVSDDSQSVGPNATDITTFSQPTPPHDDASYDDEDWFACLWRHQLELCPRIFDSKEDLLRHVSEHVS